MNMHIRSICRVPNRWALLAFLFIDEFFTNKHFLHFFFFFIRFAIDRHFCRFSMLTGLAFASTCIVSISMHQGCTTLRISSVQRIIRRPHAYFSRYCYPGQFICLTGVVFVCSDLASPRGCLFHSLFICIFIFTVIIREPQLWKGLKQPWPFPTCSLGPLKTTLCHYYSASSSCCSGTGAQTLIVILSVFTHN